MLPTTRHGDHEARTTDNGRPSTDDRTATQKGKIGGPGKKKMGGNEMTNGVISFKYDT